MRPSPATNPLPTQAPPAVESCAKCKATKPDLKACPRGCQMAKYCNAKCRTGHWKEHKKSCEVKK